MCMGPWGWDKAVAVHCKAQRCSPMTKMMANICNRFSTVFSVPSQHLQTSTQLLHQSWLHHYSWVGSPDIGSGRWLLHKPCIEQVYSSKNQKQKWPLSIPSRTEAALLLPLLVYRLSCCTQVYCTPRPTVQQFKCFPFSWTLLQPVTHNREIHFHIHTLQALL